MKRYMLFGYSDYYPSGGMHDFIDSYDSIEEAKLHIKVRGISENTMELYDIQENEFIDLN